MSFGGVGVFSGGFGVIPGIVFGVCVVFDGGVVFVGVVVSGGGGDIVFGMLFLGWWFL